MKKLGIFLILIQFLYCPSSQKKEGDGFIYVKDVTGINDDDAEMNAKRKIIEQGIGELVEGEETVIDAESREKIINATIEGVVYAYSQIGPTRKKGQLVEIDAKGKVNPKSLKTALEELMKRQDNPNFLMLVEERINGKLSSSNSVATENAIAGRFKEFTILDKAQFMRILAKEGGKPVGVYGNPKEEEKALAAAAEMEAQILLIGTAEVRNAGEIEGSGLFSHQATLKLKFVDVGSAHIVAAENTTGAYPHVSPESGAQEAIQKAVEKIYPKVREQFVSKWTPGTLIRVVIEGMDYDTFLDKDIQGQIRKIKGVNNVSVKGNSNVNKMIPLEVKAMFNGVTLYRKMRERKGDMGIEFTQKEVKPGNLHLIVK